MFSFLKRKSTAQPAPTSNHLARGTTFGESETTVDLIEVAGADAAAVIAEVSRNRDVSPVILGPRKSVEMIFDPVGERNVRDTVARAAKFDFAGWLEQARDEARRASDETGAPVPPIGTKLGEPLLTDAIDAAVLDAQRSQPHKTVYIALIPDADVTTAPAYLSDGGWNAFPDAAVHIGLMRRWRDRFGARLIGHEFDMLTFHVVRPPATIEDALDLAEEHYAYCPDVIDQGYGSLRGLAGALLNAPTWQFWWD